MKILLGTDHAGFSLKEKVKAHLMAQGYDVTDLGAHTYEEGDDYPEYVARVAQGVSEAPHVNRGIVFGGSGQGEAIVANKFVHVRAVVYVGDRHTNDSEQKDILILTREHNDANVLSIGARFVEEGEIFDAVERWLSTPFSNDERHVRRIAQIETVAKR